MRHARRMAEATTSPLFDRRAPREGVIEVAGLTLPRAGDLDVAIDGHALRLTNLDRVLYPASGFTKAELCAYYLAIAPAILPHLRERPLTVGRFPGGVDGRGFAQAEVPGRPSFVRATPITLVRGETKQFTLIDDRAGLLWLAQMGTIELHPFLGTAAALDRPTHVVFDLDPGPLTDPLAVARVTLLLCDELARRGLPVRLKTSGAAGFHILLPTDGSYEASRAFAADIARVLVAREPALITDRMPKRERVDKVLIDVRQNSERLSTVAPYSLRATDRPTVSTPIDPSELAAMRDAAEWMFEAPDVLARVAAGLDPWSS